MPFQKILYCRFPMMKWFTRRNLCLIKCPDPVRNGLPTSGFYLDTCLPIRGRNVSLWAGSSVNGESGIMMKASIGTFFNLLLMREFRNGSEILTISIEPNHPCMNWTTMPVVLNGLTSRTGREVSSALRVLESAAIRLFWLFVILRRFPGISIGSGFPEKVTGKKRSTAILQFMRGTISEIAAGGGVFSA